MLFIVVGKGGKIEKKGKEREEKGGRPRTAHARTLPSPAAMLPMGLAASRIALMPWRLAAVAQVRRALVSLAHRFPSASAPPCVLASGHACLSSDLTRHEKSCCTSQNIRTKPHYNKTGIPFV
jgi:hypothetical protein